MNAKHTITYDRGSDGTSKDKETLRLPQLRKSE